MIKSIIKFEQRSSNKIFMILSYILAFIMFVSNVFFIGYDVELTILTLILGSVFYLLFQGLSFYKLKNANYLIRYLGVKPKDIVLARYALLGKTILILLLAQSPIIYYLINTVSLETFLDAFSSSNVNVVIEVNDIENYSWFISYLADGIIESVVWLLFILAIPIYFTYYQLYNYKEFAKAKKNKQLFSASFELKKLKKNLSLNYLMFNLMIISASLNLYIRDLLDIVGIKFLTSDLLTYSFIIITLASIYTHTYHLIYYSNRQDSIFEWEV
jgi:hypothetical protein